MLLEAKSLTKSFHRGRVKAVDGVSFSLKKGETLGVIGESGSGKSTLAKLVMKLAAPDSGEIYFDGKNLARASAADLKIFRRKAQIIFQDPFLSLDPRWKVSEILAEPFFVNGFKDKEAIREKVKQLLFSVELNESFLGRAPRELSGGECQRIAIARAISVEPDLVVCDEPVSALDVLVQAQILNLLLKLQKEKGVSYLFISHDLRVVAHMSDRVLVMKGGKAALQNTLQ